MPRFGLQENTTIDTLEYASGISRRFPKQQRVWQKAALESTAALVKAGVYTQLEFLRDKKLVEKEKERRYKTGTPAEKEFPEKVDATLSLMKFFDLDEKHQGIEVIPVTDYDKLATGARFLLSGENGSIGIAVDTVLNDRGARAVAHGLSTALNSGDVEKIATSDLKYIEDENIRGKIVPIVHLVFLSDKARKMADVANTGNDKSLSAAEKDALGEIRLEIELAIQQYIRAINDFINLAVTSKNSNQETLDKMKEIRDKLQAFKKAF